MFVVDEVTAEAIRRAHEESGELAGVVELRRHFPLLQDNTHARDCVRMIRGFFSTEITFRHRIGIESSVVIFLPSDGAWEMHLLGLERQMYLAGAAKFAETMKDLAS